MRILNDYNDCGDDENGNDGGGGGDVNGDVNDKIYPLEQRSPHLNFWIMDVLLRACDSFGNCMQKRNMTVTMCMCLCVFTVRSLSFISISNSSY